MAVMNINIRNNEVFNQLSSFGKFQTIQYFLICLPLVVVSMINVNYVFVAESVNIRCRVAECDGENATISTPPWWPESVDTKCYRPIFNLTEPNASCSNRKVKTLAECDEWIYEDSNSVIAELNIGCQPWKASLVGTIHNVGMLLSMFSIGWMADKFGRKPTLVVGAVGGVIGLLKMFINNFYAYLCVELLEAIVAAGLYTVAIVLMIEVGGETKRVITGVILSYAVYTGEVLFAVIAMRLKYWKSLILATYTPAIIFVVYALVLRESTRWQLLRGKTAEAKNTLKNIAKLNRLNINDEDIFNINEDVLRYQLKIALQKEKETIKDIIKSKEIMIRIGVSSFCFFAACFVYYGLFMHAALLPGDKYLNVALTAMAAFPGDLLAFFTFSKYGRRISLQCGFIAIGFFIIAQAFTPNSMSRIKLTLFLLSKLGSALCLTGMFTYTLELFPTSVRGSLVGFCNTIGRMGSVLSPLTPLLVTEFITLPPILFASTAVTSAVLLSFTPETKYLPMFDTIREVEAYKLKHITKL